MENYTRDCSSVLAVTASVVNRCGIERGVVPDICRHPLMRHTVWYWIEDPYDPELIPYELHFDDRRDALKWASEQIVDPSNTLRWIKIFRAHNETYECYRWENPEPYISPREDNKVVSVMNPRGWWQLRR